MRGAAFLQRRTGQAGHTGRMRNYLSRASMQVLLGVVVVAVLMAAGWLAVTAPHLPPYQLVPAPVAPLPAHLLPAHPHAVPSPHAA